MHILIVEDDPGVSHMMMRMIEGAGHTVVTARTGWEAVRDMHAVKFDLVLLDLVLEGSEMSGYDVARVKQWDPDLRDIPMIVTSGVSPEEIRHEATTTTNILSSAVLILSKPIALETLLNAIEHVAKASEPPPKT